MRLIADVGGTNTRLALSEAGVVLPDTVHSFPNADWDTLYDVVAAFWAARGQPQLTQSVLAVAGPVRDNNARLTNRDWEVSTAALAQITGNSPAYLINDLTALGYAAPVLREDQRRLVSAGEVRGGAVSQSMVVGIGTGFNIAPVIETSGRVACPAIEAGHIGMPDSVGRRLPKLGLTRDAFPTIETLFSGRGFATFCNACTRQTGWTGPAAIAAYDAQAPSDITRAIDQYAALLGQLLRDLSLAYVPASGIYLAGSVARSLLQTAPEPCIRPFRAPGNALVCNTAPIWMIADDLAALSGCAQVSFQR